jgi:hypothetical protein
MLTSDTSQALALLQDYAAKIGRRFRITSGYRTCQEQWDIYNSGVRPAAPGCQSWHTQGRAFDIEAEDGPKAAAWYEPLGEFWRSIGGTWPDVLGDPGHLEWHPGSPNIATLCPDPSTCVMFLAPTVYPRKSSAFLSFALAAILAGGALFLARRKVPWLHR